MRIADVVGTITLNSVHPSLVGSSFKLATPLSWDNLRLGKGDRRLLPERPEGGHRRAALVVAQKVPVPFSQPEPLEEIVVLDELGAGIGSRIAVSEGREAAMPFHPEVKPVDAYNAAIIDHLDYDP